MDLYLIWRLILRQLPIVIIASISGLALGFVLTLNTKPLYSATSEIFVSTPAAVLDISALAQGSNFTQQRVKSYAQLISAEGTLAPVIQELHLKTTPVELAKEIKATVPVDTVIIDVTVKDQSPAMAMNIANAVATAFSNSVQILELPGMTGESSVKATLSRQATLPTSPVSPKLSLNVALGILMGFSIGLLIAIIIHFGDLTVKNSDHLAGLPLLGVFKFEKKAKSQPLVSRLQPYAARTEEFRQLRTSILHQVEKHGLGVIGITSALPVEGKTTTSINFAYSLQEAGYGVLLIEADMRRPQISQYIYNNNKLGKELGLSSLLQVTSNTSLPREIKKSIFYDELNKIDIIFAGMVPSNPTELLSNGNLVRILASVRKSYDFVILDCPPVLPIADSPVLASVVDQFILVVRAGTTRIQQFKGAVEILQKVNAGIMGVVLNMIPVGRKSDEYGYQYGSYRAYGYNSTPGYAPRDIDLQNFVEDPTRPDKETSADRAPRYAPKSERAPRYAPKSERAPRYAPKSERAPRYAPKSKSFTSSEIWKEDDIDILLSKIIDEQMSEAADSGSAANRIFKKWFSREKKNDAETYDQ